MQIPYHANKDHLSEKSGLRPVLEKVIIVIPICFWCGYKAWQNKLF